ncbi:MAG: tryptophan-rich sensory protein [Planctomycetes bacterium]|nr:tryptophan-rich sensory protein [Planctomycetota bacterium]
MKALALAVFLLLSFGAAAFGARFAPGEWYVALRKPPWNPPGWVFGPVWTALYAAMAVAAWRVWRAAPPARARPALAAWAVQLVLNAAWSWLFFGLREPGLAFAEILALWAAILATTVLFLRRDRAAGWLMVPYLAWVSFAAVLNFVLWRLNA